MIRVRIALLVTSLLCMAVTCETDLIDDAGFQLWCGERLCAWDLEQGSIRKVSTWHTHDYGVDLLGPQVVLSAPAQNSTSSVRIEVTSNIEENAAVSLEIDRDGDGAIDWSVSVPPSDGYVSRLWDPDVGVGFDGVFYIRKSGEGRAVLARVRASPRPSD